MSRIRAFVVALAAITTIGGCSNNDRSHDIGFISSPTAPSASPVPGLTSLTLSPSSIDKNVGETQVVQVGFVPETFTGKITLSFQIPDNTVAMIQSTDEVKGTVTVLCRNVGITTISVTAGTVREFAVITCKSVPAGTPPPSVVGPTVASIIGTYAKHGRRISGTCVPPLFTADWDADLTVESSADGSHGIRFREDHVGVNDAGPFGVTMFYSQFDVQTGSNGDLIFKSGTPTRTIPGRGDVITQIELTFKGDGTISGRETFVGPGGCVEVYELSGKRK